MPASEIISEISSAKRLNVRPGSEEKLVMEHGICEHERTETLYTGQTLKLNKYHFKDPQGNECVWEAVERVEKPLNGNAHLNRPLLTIGAHNMCTIAVLRRSIMCDCLILVKQYRAQLKAYTLEFPASVINKNQNLVDIANEEIAHDTGFTSTDVKHISPPTSIDPDLSTSQISLVSIMIDGDDPLQHHSAKNTLASGGHGDIVEVLRVPINGLLDRLDKYSEEGVIIDSLVYAFAMGLKKGEKLTLASLTPDLLES